MEKVFIVTYQVFFPKFDKWITRTWEHEYSFYCINTTDAERLFREWRQRETNDYRIVKIDTKINDV